MILLDEPNQGLDFRHQHLLFGLLDSLRKKGNLIIVSHHDLNTAYHYASHVWLMKSGRCISQGAARKCMTREILESVFDCHVSVTKMSENGVIFQTCLDKNEISSGN